MPRLAVVLGFLLLSHALGGGCVIDRQITEVEPVVCGNGVCQAGESPGRCPVDCPIDVCGNQVCEPTEWDSLRGSTCEADCPPVPALPFDCREYCSPQDLDLPFDCIRPSCGNGLCEARETVADCPDDCFPGYCGDGRCDANEQVEACPGDCAPTTQVDLLFVVDDSEAMAEEQERLSLAMSALEASLRSPAGQGPDLHVGVISANLGTDLFALPDCMKDGMSGGDGGRLLTPANPAYAGITFLSDDAPTGCTITRTPDGTCTAYECRETSCDAAGGGLTVDARTGCPRCRNFTGDLAVAMGDFVRLGTAGCRFAQPLEAMWKALDVDSGATPPVNPGFLRTDSILGVVFLTNQDDCSASNWQVYDDSQTLIDSPLGPLTTFRCFEFGVTCRPTDSRTAQGPRTDCRPRDDPGALLHPVSRYLDRLDALRDPGRRVVMVGAGPVNAHTVNVIRQGDTDDPEVAPSCTSASGESKPAIRLADFVFRSAGGNAEPLPWVTPCGSSFSSCESTYDPHLEAFGQALRRRLAP